MLEPCLLQPCFHVAGMNPSSRRPVRTRRGAAPRASCSRAPRPASDWAAWHLSVCLSIYPSIHGIHVLLFIIVVIYCRSIYLSMHRSMYQPIHARMHARTHACMDVHTHAHMRTASDTHTRKQRARNNPPLSP